MDTKRITLFAGHYGSGKTNLAVNYALLLKQNFEKVLIADLDIVNPYFRTKDSEATLNAAGIRFISSKYANTNVDVPALPAEAYAIVNDKSSHAVADIGGDDRGALALGRYSDMILEENNFEMLFVINKYRVMTPDSGSAVDIMREIELASKIPFTAIVNNSNLGEFTQPATVLDSLGFAEEVSQMTGLPIKFTSVKKGVAESLEGHIENLLPINLYNKALWVL